MAVKIALVNNKGGSSKTTSLVNIAGALAKKFPNKKVLIIDGDAQGNAARSFNIDSSEFETTVYDIFLGNNKAKDAIVKAYENIDIIPANSDMNFLEFDMMEKYNAEQASNMYGFFIDLINNNINENVSFDEFSGMIPGELSLNNSYFNMLEKKITQVDKEYDYILFDTPPELKAVTSSILSVSDYVIIPYEPDVYSLDGIYNIVQRIKSIKEGVNKKLEIAGILGSKVKKTTTLHNAVIKDVVIYCLKNNINYFETEIPNSVRYAHSIAYEGLPTTITDPTTKYAEVYYKVVDELLNFIN